MGLAILDLEDTRSGQLQFRADTGTNPWYQLRFGRKAGRRDGFDEIDELVHTTALARNAKAGWAFDTRVVVQVPGTLVREARYAQLVSYKDERGRSPAYSRPVVMAVGAGSYDDDAQLFTFSLEAPMSVSSFEAPRIVPCRTVAESFTLPPALGDLLGQIVKLAGPVVADLLKPATAQPAQAGQPAPGAGAPGIIADILRAILGAVAAPAPVPVSTGKSLVRPLTVRPAENRFNRPTYAVQQIFGIDDALLATMIGPILQVLPQLLNAASAEKIQLRQTNNKLITDLMAGLDRRRMMELLAQARAASPGNPALAALNGLFEEEAAARATQPPPATTGQQSLENAPPPPAATSSKAVLSFLLAPPVEWYGEPHNVFSKANPMALHLQLDVGASGPKKSLPRSVVHLVVKDGTERVLHQQDFRLVDIEPGKPIVLDLEPGDVSHLPTNVPLSLAVQLRWPGGRPGSAYQASAVTDVVLVEKVFVTGQGGPVAGDTELVDMQTYRSFWNKVWESPTTQATPGEDGSSHWNLEAAIKYTVLYAPTQASNGLMETKGLTVAPDPDSPIDKSEGRFKGGIELSLGEVNKLLPLWPGEQPLAPDVLAALSTPEFARRTAGEAIHSLRLKGGKRERGLVWAVPVFSLRDVHLGVVEATDDSGQVTKVGKQQARFPVPSAVRVLTMKSEG